MGGGRDIAQADVLLVVLVNESARLGRECRCLLLFFQPLFAQEGCEFCDECHREVVGNLSVLLCFMLDGAEEAQDF